jgi:hypothetical protein
LLKEAKQHHEDNNSGAWAGKNFPLVRVNFQDGVKYVLGNQAYFESSIQENFENISIVKRELYTKDKANKNLDENAVSFLKSIGVREFDERTVIEQKLIKYNSSYNPHIKTFISSNYADIQYFNDIKLFISYWKKRPSEIGLFKKCPFLIGLTIDSKLSFFKPNELYLDKPFIKTGLGEAQEIHQKIAVWDGYQNKLNKIELKYFIEFLQALEVMSELQIIEARIGNNPKWRNGELYSHCRYARNSDNYIGNDYSIEKLDGYLNYQSIENSHLVWNALIRADKKHAKVRYRPNAQHDIREEDSQLIYHLKNHAWIPTKSGEFLNPKAMTRDDLRDDFPFNNNNGLLTAIEFGKYSEIREAEENKRKEQQKDSFKQKQRLAKELGAESVDEVKEAIKLFNEIKNQGKTIEEVRAIFNPKKPDFEDDYSSNPSRRAEKLKEDALNSPKKLKEVRLRSVSDGEHEKVKQRAKEYLKDRYTINDVLYCQICKKEMPFKLSDGSYYFEAVSLINDTEKSYIYNFIALCPIDAAKFKFANTSKNNMKTLIKEIIENRTHEEINNNKNGKNYIELVLADNSEVIEFTPKHLGDIKSTLDN